MKKFVISALAAVMALVATGAAWSADVFDEMSAKRLESILKSLEDDEVIESWEETDDAGAYRFTVDGVNYLLINNDDDLQLYCAFGSDGVSTKKINAWNSEHFFSRAYVDKDRDPAIESDLYLAGGVTERRVKIWILQFCIQVGEFRDEMLD